MSDASVAESMGRLPFPGSQAGRTEIAASNPLDFRFMGWSIPREGRYWLVVVAVLGLAGWLKAIGLLLYVANFLLILWIVNVVVAARGFRGLHAWHRWSGPIWAGQPTVREIRLENESERRLPPLVVHTDGREAALAMAVEPLAPRTTTTLRGELCFLARGRQSCPALWATCRAPLGLVERAVTLAPPEEVVVLPRRGAIHGDSFRRWLMRATRGDGRPHQLTRPSMVRDTDLYGLRPFRHGDSPRHIHWRTSARRNELMVREFADAHPRQLLLVVAPDSDGEGATSAARLEALLSVATTIAWEWCRQADEGIWLVVGGPIPRIWPNRRTREQTIPALEALAEIRPGLCDPVKLVELAAEAPESAVVLVLGRMAVADDVERRLRRAVAWCDPEARFEFYEPPRW